jgi:hypothetical protein
MLRCWLLTTLLLGQGIGSCIASPRDDAFAGISRCSGIQDDRVALDCIYGAAQPLRRELGLAPAPAFQTKLVPPVKGTPETSPLAVEIRPPNKESFLQRLIGEDPISERRVRITAYSFDHRGLFTITLSNGEIWSQLADDSNRAHWGWPAQEHYVSVQGDTSGADLEIDREEEAFKVQRLH